MTLPHRLSKEALGYQIHTNRELGMMLLGVKPLAVFSDILDRFPDVVTRYLRMFDRYCEAGVLEKREYVDLDNFRGADGRRVLVVLYSLPNESWRIDAMIKLREQLSAWNAEAERMEGSLLGYQEWQNDIWMATRFGHA